MLRKIRATYGMTRILRPAPGTGRTASGGHGTLHKALSINQFLRVATAEDHRAVDAAYAGFVLTDRDDYCRFLAAQSRALGAVERALVEVPGWRSRESLIADDLAMMGEGLPESLAIAAPDSVAAAWGMLYVLEGSRLGGAVLARMTDPRLPRAFLSAGHAPGEWRAFRERMEQAVDRAGDGHDAAAWRQDALAAARAVFALFLNAAQQERDKKDAGAN